MIGVFCDAPKENIMKIKIAAITLFLAFFGIGLGFAQVNDSRWWADPNVASKLSITEAEKAKLDSFYDASQKRRIDLKSAVAKARLDLDASLENPKSSDAALKANYQRLTQAQNALAYERFNFIVQIRQVLGPQRFAAFKSVFDERRHDRMNRWRENGGERRGGGMGPQSSAGNPSRWDD